jgi:hypothetical protein
VRLLLLLCRRALGPCTSSSKWQALPPQLPPTRRRLPTLPAHLRPAHRALQCRHSPPVSICASGCHAEDSCFRISALVWHGMHVLSCARSAPAAGAALPDVFRVRLAADPTTCLGVDGAYTQASLRIFRCTEASWRYESMTFAASPVEGTW